jgi:hypothetical protein
MILVYVGFEVLTTVIMRSTISWDTMVCSSLKVKALLAPWFHAGFLLGLFFNPEDEGDMSVDFQWTTQHYSPEDSTLQF